MGNKVVAFLLVGALASASTRIWRIFRTVSFELVMNVSSTSEVSWSKRRARVKLMEAIDLF